MNRLVEEESVEPLAREAARLARSVELTEPPLGVEQRIRAQLFYGRSGQRARRAAYRLRPAFAGIVLIGSMALAAVAVHNDWGRRNAPKPAAVLIDAPAPHASAATSIETPVVTSTSAVVPSESVPVMAPMRPARHRSKVEEPTPVADQPKTTAPVADELAVTPEPVGPAPSAPVAIAPIAKETAVEVKAAEERASAALLVVEGTRALRRDHDAKRALPLLEEYLRRYPDGDLAEEALALAVQAKSMRNDASAASLAKQYLARFPTGRFRDEAQAAANRFAH